jgi:DNA-binding NtrC family response regulator
MQQVFRAIGRLSRSSVRGADHRESGTGKELVARACTNTARARPSLSSR